jgi:hypothetical protein
VQAPLDANKYGSRAALLVSSTAAEAAWFPTREVSMIFRDLEIADHPNRCVKCET